MIRALFLILVCSASLVAGDFAKLEVLGFSQDGRYLAFEEFGTLDGSGFPYSSIFFIDTSKNSFAASPVTVRIDRENASEAAARSRAGLLAAKSLRQFRIVRGNTGSLVVSRLLTDLSSENKEDSARFAEEVGSMYHKGDYELQLKENKVTVKPCDDYGDDTFMFELVLKSRENDWSRSLQKDTTLPASRGCALDYGIRSVYVYKEMVAVFLNVYTRGFEGPDLRHLVVTGKLA